MINNSNPKKNISNMRLRPQGVGNIRRKQNLGRILDKSANFPKGVTIKDIDQAFTEWVEKDLYLTFEGKELPTLKLFSNQRISEYAQTWSHSDSTVGNILMNFKGITRENNPKKGENQGSVFNVPGNRDYVMGYKAVLQENGEEAYDVYTMKQPVSVDLIYTVSLITNKYQLINEMNQLMQNKFSALQCYLFPNGHAMPMKLEDTSDESEYGVDDRKYYAQTYKITLLAYLIDPEGFKITHLPSRFRIMTAVQSNKSKKPVKVKIEEWNPADECPPENETPFENQNVNIIVEFPSCHKTVDFTIDMNLTIDEIELNNINDFVFYINKELQDFESDKTFLLNEDQVHIEIERDDPFKDSSIIIKCKNNDVIFDTRQDPESALDEKDYDIDIEIKNGEEN